MEVQELRNLLVMSPDHGSMSMFIMHADSHQVPNPTPSLCALNWCLFFVTTSSWPSEEITQTSGKMASKIAFSGLRPIPLNINRLLTSSGLSITHYWSHWSRVLKNLDDVYEWNLQDLSMCKCTMTIHAIYDSHNFYLTVHSLSLRKEVGINLCMKL